jgi:serine/threonine-protein kinase HipA
MLRYYRPYNGQGYFAMIKHVCHCCLKECEDSFCYSCRKSLFDGRKVNHVLEFSSPEFTDRKLKDGSRLSISGVQLKHSLKLEKNKLRLAESGGQYIVKPVPHGAFKHMDQLPANEHLTMQIAKQVFNIDASPNAFVYFSDKKPAYITRRFDIAQSGTRYIVEDFAQIAQRSIETNGEDYKYNFSYEEIGELVKKHVAASELELEKLFTIVLFNYLISNGDAHLKNFSLYRNYEFGDYLFTPAYDLVCTKIHSPYESDMALELFKDGYESENYKHSSKYTTVDFIEFGKRLGIKSNTVKKILEEFSQKLPLVNDLVSRSFLSKPLQKIYLELFQNKCERIQLNL